MAYCFYNGVKLPELPSDTLANYPYCWIRKNDNTQHYDLIFTKVLGYYDATAGGIVYGANEGTAEIVHYRVAYPGDTADSWENYQTTNTWMALDSNRTVMWSNHYIPNGSFTATTMYFDAYEAIPEMEAYQIEKDTVVGIADQVRRLCKTEATMTPAQIESNLGGLNIELMETFVMSTPVEQVIYPDAGYYGFSKITIGAVDATGGWGDDYGGSVEDNTWGDEYLGEDVPTGNLDYTGGDNPNYIPPIPGGDNQILLDKEKEEGSSIFRYHNGIEEWEIQASKPVFACAIFGAYYLDSAGYWVRVVYIVSYSNTYYFTRGREVTSLYWGAERDATAIGSGYVNYHNSTSISGGDPDVLEEYHTPSGVPFYRIGKYSSEGEFKAARDNLLRSLIGGTNTEGSKQYIAFSSDSPIQYDGAYIKNADGSPINIYEYDPEGSGEWVQIGTTDGSGYPVGNYDRVWNSHDIKDENGTVTYPKSSEPVAEIVTGNIVATPVEREGTYSVDGSTMNGLVGAAQKVTGGTTPLTPSQAADVLDEYHSQPKAEEMTF